MITTSFSPANSTPFDLDEATDWVGELLAELNEDLSSDELSALDEETFLTIEGEVIRKTTGKLEDHILIKAKLNTVFGTRCVQSGEPMLDHLEVEMNMVVVDEEVIEKYSYQEETSLFVEDKEFEIYPQKNNRFDFKEAVHEFIWLFKDPYPTKD